MTEGSAAGVAGDGDAAGGAWLSKSDLTAFLRCAQGFTLLKTRAVLEVAAAGSAAGVLLERGTEFDRRVREHGTPVVGDDGGQVTLAELLGGDALIYCDELFVNRELRLRGVPDGIHPAGGAVEPLEIKSYSGYSERDLFELAFYWLLLEPHRTHRDATPAGWLQVRVGGGGAGEPFRVLIPDELISAVRGCVAAARSVLAEGIDPYWCDCSVCSQQLPAVTTPQFRSTAPVGVVNGVGPARAAALGEVGVGRVADLLAADASEIQNRLRNNPSHAQPVVTGHDSAAGLGCEVGSAAVRARAVPSLATIGKWKRHAEVFVAGEPRMLAGVGAALPDRFIALDLEYRSESPKVVWSVCVQTQGVSPAHRLTVVADADHQGQLIAELGEYLARHPGVPIVTWNGAGADLPVLTSVMGAYPMPSSIDVAAVMADIRDRHLDLLRWTKEAVVLPFPGTGLKDVAEYFGAANTAPGMDGFVAAHLWEQYQYSRDDTVLAELVAYNRSDVALLVDVANHLRSLHHRSHEVVAGDVFDVDDLRCHQSRPRRGGVARQSAGIVRRIARRLSGGRPTRMVGG